MECCNKHIFILEILLRNKNQTKYYVYFAKDYKPSYPPAFHLFYHETVATEMAAADAVHHTEGRPQILPGVR